MRAEKLTSSLYVLGGVRGIAPGAFTGGLLCSLLQLGYNELRVWRVRYVHREHAEQVLHHSTTPSMEESGGRTHKRTAWESVLSLVGVHKLTDEERIKKLKAQREQALVRIAELEEEERERQAETPPDPESGEGKADSSST